MFGRKRKFVWVAIADTEGEIGDRLKCELTISPEPTVLRLANRTRLEFWRTYRDRRPYQITRILTFAQKDDEYPLCVGTPSGITTLSCGEVTAISPGALTIDFVAH